MLSFHILTIVIQRHYLDQKITSGANGGRRCAPAGGDAAVYLERLVSRDGLALRKLRRSSVKNIRSSTRGAGNARGIDRGRQATAIIESGADGANARARIGASAEDELLSGEREVAHAAQRVLSGSSTGFRRG